LYLGLVLEPSQTATAQQRPELIYNLAMPEHRPDPPANPAASNPAVPFVPITRTTATAPPAGMPPAPVPPPPPLPALRTTDFQIGEEFGTAKRNLPPAGIVLICIAAVAVVVGLIAFKERPKPQGAGSIDLVTASEVPGQNMILAAITLTLRNTGKEQFWIKTITAQLTTADGQTFDDEAASAVDLDRYYQAFPALRENSEAPISREGKLNTGTEQKGTIIVSFKVTREIFDQRKSLTVAIQPYDQVMPVILK
jgi:hypothetical protein